MYDIEGVRKRFVEIVSRIEKLTGVAIEVVKEPTLIEWDKEPGHWHWRAVIKFSGYHATYHMEYHPNIDDDPEAVAESAELTFRQIQDLEPDQ